MSYTDEDILDLYEDLQTVGLAETPAEQAERLRVTFIQDHGLDSFYNFKVWEDFLTVRRVDYCFVTRVEFDSDSIVSFRVYPSINNRVLIKPKSFPVEIISLWKVPDENENEIDFLDSYSELVNHISSLRDKFCKCRGSGKIRIKKGK